MNYLLLSFVWKGQCLSFSVGHKDNDETVANCFMNIGLECIDRNLEIRACPIVILPKILYINGELETKVSLTINLVLTRKRSERILFVPFFALILRSLSTAI